MAVCVDGLVVFLALSPHSLFFGLFALQRAASVEPRIHTQNPTGPAAFFWRANPSNVNDLPAMRLEGVIWVAARATCLAHCRDCLLSGDFFGLLSQYSHLHHTGTSLSTERRDGK